MLPLIVGLFLLLMSDSATPYFKSCRQHFDVVRFMHSFLFFVDYRPHRWALCPSGHFLRGLYRTSGDWLYNIEEGKCCKPVGLPNKYAKCVDKDITVSFDNKGLSSCDDGYYMVGFYKGSCNQLYCIEKIKCCKMHESECSKTAS